MSQRLIDHSPDLKQLRDEGYDLEIRENLLLLKNVPYVNSDKQVKYGMLVSELSVSGEKTAKPDTHALYFAGEYPCNRNGEKVTQIVNSEQHKTLGKDIVVDYFFSSKPAIGYKDYYEKMTTYVAILSGPAQHLDPSVTAKTFPVVQPEAEESVFNYFDTASSRAGISAVSAKLALGRVAIVGLGGTGSYVLDLISKTPIGEIHLFDDDTYSNHNAFRSPGAPTIEELSNQLKKVIYFSMLYSRMHRHIIPHEYYISAENIETLRGMDFVFLCLDGGSIKKLIIEKLEEWGTPFVDTGMGILHVDDFLIGILRVTTSTNNKHNHSRRKISLSEDGGNNDYAQNIQVADLNALNAALAVIKWKKLFGFYQDLENEHNSTYTINVNMLRSEDQL